jgi:hypothetical protein
MSGIEADSPVGHPVPHAPSFTCGGAGCFAMEIRMKKDFYGLFKAKAGQAG